VVPRGSGCGCNSYGYRGRSIRGGSWAALRRGMGQGSFFDPTRRWVRNHYLRRFPFAHAEGLEADRMKILLSEDLLAVMEAEEGKPPILDTETRLDRAASRFFVSDYDGAREDLKAVLADKPKEPRAHWGLFLCAVCKSDWGTAGAELKTLAEAGEIRAGDRLDPDSTFANPKVFPSLVRGLRTYADMKISDGRIHLITAWALSTQGEIDMAKRYITMARHWDADAVTTTAVSRALNGGKSDAKKTAPKKVEPQKAETQKQGRIERPRAPVRDTQPGERAPDSPELERQVAKAEKATTQMASR
jgi:hypothetical protein